MLKITRKATSEMRVRFFIRITSDRRKMLLQTRADNMLKVYRNDPYPQFKEGRTGSLELANGILSTLESAAVKDAP